MPLLLLGRSEIWQNPLVLHLNKLQNKVICSFTASENPLIYLLLLSASVTSCKQCKVHHCHLLDVSCSPLLRSAILYAARFPSIKHFLQNCPWIQVNAPSQRVVQGRWENPTLLCCSIRGDRRAGTPSGIWRSSPSSAARTELWNALCWLVGVPLISSYGLWSPERNHSNKSRTPSPPETCRQTGQVRERQTGAQTVRQVRESEAPLWCPGVQVSKCLQVFVPLRHEAEDAVVGGDQRDDDALLPSLLLTGHPPFSVTEDHTCNNTLT